uniref:stellacyanin-like n=1 Tax=Erigeron canadensis TaxID=72917 RepID=UPI001CB97EB6|nr:stellacyanin-like [Erigeron canadensis]
MASFSPIFFLFLAVFTFTSVVSTEEYQVGGVVGWRIPATNESELYTVWASRRRFHIGDSLRFAYKNDSVVVVEKWGYYHCDSSHPIAFYNDGNTVVTLDKVGKIYFISGDAHRCKQGVNMILEVINPGPVRYFPPTIANPPDVTYSGMAPGPSQFVSSGGPPESSPGPSSSDAVRCFSVSVIVVGIFVGLGLSLLNF